MRQAILTCFAIAILAVGCSSTDGKTAAARQGETVAAQLDQANTQLDKANTQLDQANTQLDQAKAETKKAETAMQDYAFAHKAEYIDMMDKKLTEIQAELDRLSAKVEDSSGTAKADAKAKLDAVRVKWNQTKSQLDKAENATESIWEDMKGGFKKSYGELKDSFEKTRQWLSDKIEP